MRPTRIRTRLTISMRHNVATISNALVSSLVLAFASISSGQSPAPVKDNFIRKDFRFHPGEMPPELRMHYMTLGKPECDRRGIVRNAVLLLHGTSGSGAGAHLDASRCFIILPDGTGQGSPANQE